MKSLAAIQKTLAAFEKKYGCGGPNAQQGSVEWLTMKLGVISASNIHRITGKPGNQTRATYMAELVSEVCTGVVEEMNFKQLEWGKAHEEPARATYEFSTGHKIVQVPFVFKDNKFREGCSPDGLIENLKGAEIKCPWDSTNYIKFLVGDAIKSEWVWQAQGCMRALDAGEWDVTQYDPRMKTKPMHMVMVPRDEEKQKFLADEIPKFVEEMDAMLTKIGVKFGEQWGPKC